MPPLQSVRVRGERDIRACPTCGFPVRIVRRNDGKADHYEPLKDDAMEGSLREQDPETAAELRELRRGKKTVALVGMAPSTCALAPWDDEECDIWIINEMHAFAWVKRVTALLQLHPRSSFMRSVAARGVRNHFEWLQQEHGFPIYMQFKNDDIPDSAEYPLVDIQEKLLARLRRGKNTVRFFTSTFAYMLALAIHQGYQRIEIYGFEMGGLDEYGPQRECAGFWMGYALGRGIEVYLPPQCQLLMGPLYGYEGQGPRNIANA